MLCGFVVVVVVSVSFIFVFFPLAVMLQTVKQKKTSALATDNETN